jgi:hypothetical protein
LPVPESPADDGVAGVDERAGLQSGDSGRWDPGRHGAVEVFQPLGTRESRLEQPPGAAPVGALVDLGGQYLGQEGAVGEPFAGGVVGDPGGLGGDGRQVQLAAGDSDGGLSGRFGHRLHALTSTAAAATRPAI